MRQPRDGGWGEREIKGQRLLIQSIDTVHRSALTHIPSQITPPALFRHPDPPPIKSLARRPRNPTPRTLRPLRSSAFGLGGGGKPLRETASERKGGATAPAIASERATAFLALVPMARIISKIFRAVLWVPVALALADCNSKRKF